MEKNCLYCLIKFPTNRNKRKFCSIKCSSNAQFEKTRKYGNCKTCKKEFKITSDNSFFCTAECYFQSKQKRVTKTVCKTCGNSFEHPDWKSHKFTFCSNECKYLRDNKSKYREKAYNAFGKKCCVCPKSIGRIEVHHIDFDRKNNDISNLCVLCHGCHLRIHALIKRTELEPKRCLEIMIKNNLYRLTPNRFRMLWQHFRSGKLDLDKEIDMSIYL